jgi:ActR/RegA family two-component response regulator
MARIVLISDDGALRRDLRRLVRQRGHSMREQPALRACQAGRLCRKEPLDAAFLDLSTTGDCGLAAVVLARARMPGVRIAVIDGGKGCNSLNRLARAVSLGADDFMKKPILVSDATDVLERLGL